MDDLLGRTAFVTGGASGIGLGIARACADEGMNVAIVDVDTTALAKAEDELSKVTKVFAGTLDIRDRIAYTTTADAVEEALGPVSLLCNNAGISGQIDIGNLSYEAFDWVIGVNLIGCYNGIQTFLPRMLGRGGDAQIVNTASEAGLCAMFGGIGFLYAASKFGVVGLSEALRVEVKHQGIGVSVLCPHAVATNILENTLRASEDLGEGIAGDLETSFDKLKPLLATGADPDTVGRRVIEGVRNNDLFILTSDHLIGQITKRASSILGGMPPSTQSS